MFCPHCHNKIPNGSNICPLCFANLAGVKPQPIKEAQGGAPDEETREHTHKSAAQPQAKKSTAYAKGSRGGHKSADRTPMIIAFGLILILLIIIIMIIRSMFGAGTLGATTTPVPQTQATGTPAGNSFVVFGASTPTPVPQIQVTATPEPEATATPEPATSTTYTTLRKGDQGAEVVTMQQALAELGYLTGAQDGNFGTGTQNAVKAFQKDNGLDEDGIAGKQTLEKLYSLSSVTPSPQTTPEVQPGDILDLPG